LKPQRNRKRKNRHWHPIPARLVERCEIRPLADACTRAFPNSRLVLHSSFQQTDKNAFPQEQVRTSRENVAYFFAVFRAVSEDR
jgi:hypothetical protein